MANNKEKKAMKKTLFRLVLSILFFTIVSACADKKAGKANEEEADKKEASYQVTVDYSQTLAQMVKAGKYDWVSSRITQEYFPLKGKGAVEAKVELVHLDKVVTTKEVLAELDRLNLRPANIEELLAFGAKHPELQKQFPIVALGSVWRDSDGYRLVPCLGWLGSERDLGLRWFGCAWSGYYRFLAVRK